MNADDINLQALINSPNRYIIPVFQRYYSWSKDNWIQLWEDIEELVEPESHRRSHFMGSLVFIPVRPTMDHEFQVIDGQQRLITFSLLLAALRYVAHQQEHETLVDEIRENYLIHKFEKGERHFRVYPRQRDRNQYMKAIQEPTLKVKGRVGEALRFFVSKVQKWGTSEKELKALLNLLKLQLDFVYIEIDDENPYQIFKSLNSTGVDLSEADLIRNFVFMHVDVEEQDDFDDHYWRPLEKHFIYRKGKHKGELNTGLITRFFRSFLMMKRKRYVPRKAVFAAFEEEYEDTGFEPVALAKELKAAAELYDIIRGIKPHAVDEIRESLAKLRALKSRTTDPLLLSLLKAVEEEEITNSELRFSIELVAGFILRRYAAQESSRGYGYTFAGACHALGKQGTAGLMSYLKRKGFPSDIQFKTNFATFRWYGGDYDRIVLEALERSFQHKEPADLSKATVEHIMPRTLTSTWKDSLAEEWERVQEEWGDTIGNLTLSAYNSELRNHPFSEKQLYYIDSNIQLNRQLAEHYEEWGEEQIKERGKNLAEKAVKIWIGLE